MLYVCWKFTWLFLQPEASFLPSGDQAMLSTQWVCPFNKAEYSTMVSTDIINHLYLESQQTTQLCSSEVLFFIPLAVWWGVSVVKSQKRTVVSPEPLARYLKQTRTIELTIVVMSKSTNGCLQNINDSFIPLTVFKLRGLLDKSEYKQAWQTGCCLFCIRDVWFTLHDFSPDFPLPNKSPRSEANRCCSRSCVNCSKARAERLVHARRCLTDTFQISSMLNIWTCWGLGHKLQTMRARDMGWGKPGEEGSPVTIGTYCMCCICNTEQSCWWPRGINSIKRVWKLVETGYFVNTCQQQHQQCVSRMVLYSVFLAYVFMTKRSLETSSGIPPSERSCSVWPLSPVSHVVWKPQ